MGIFRNYKQWCVTMTCYNNIMILGIDEVGRGSWAGPPEFGAVALGGAQRAGLTDR